jgi:hypothetical protein
MTEASTGRRREGRGSVLVWGWGGYGAGGEEEAGGAGELGLGVDQEKTLGGDLVAGAEAGADDVDIAAGLVFEARAEGEGGDFETDSAVGFASGDAPGDVTDAGGEDGGFGDEGERGGRFGGLQVRSERGFEPGVDKTAGEQAAVGIAEVQVDLAGAEVGIELGSDPSNG